MQTQYLIQPEAPQVPPYDGEQMAQGLASELAVFLFPLLVRLDQLLDKRLVRTFLHTIQVIITFRDRVGGLLLSELGGYLLSPDQAPAGTKRLSNLLHSPKWKAQVVEEDLWQRADQQVQHFQEQGHGIARREAGDGDSIQLHGIGHYSGGPELVARACTSARRATQSSMSAIPRACRRISRRM